MPGVGFFSFLIIGALAGWIAERALNRDHGLLTNMLVGIAGSFVGGTLASLLGFDFYGFVGNLVVATVGAIIILWFFGRAEKGRQPPQPGPTTWPQQPDNNQGSIFTSRKEDRRN
jgi:uncharacterized membrane protein YeaQ/YmgE (transglycosylase-associated protein family)